jgi:hypothetical protein
VLVSPATSQAEAIQKATGTSDVISAVKGHRGGGHAMSFQDANGNTVDVPADASQGVSIGLGSGRSITMGVANSQGAAGAVTNTTGTTTYVNAKAHTTTAVQLTADGVRQAVLLDSPAAGTSFTIPLTLPVGTNLVSDGKGGYDVTASASGVTAVIGNVNAPWAKDAKGKPLATSYGLKGGTLTQIVNTKNATYPIAADPTIYLTCGIATCSYYFSKAETVKLHSYASTIGYGKDLGATMCGLIALVGGPVGVIGTVACVAYMVTEGHFLSSALSNAAVTKGCLRIRVSRLGGLAAAFYSDHTSYCKAS